MVWMDQGRQSHGWFGHGTSQTKLEPVSPEERDELRARTTAVVEFAADSLQGSDAAAATEVRASRDALKKLVPAWADGAHLPPNAFRQAFIGSDADSVDAWLVQRAVLATMRADTYAGLKDAGLELAAAAQSVGGRAWPQFVATARVQTGRDEAKIVPVQFTPASPASPPQPAPERSDGDSTFSPNREGWHDYTHTSKNVCPAEYRCSKEEMADYMSRFGIPGQNPLHPLKDRQSSWVFVPDTEIPAGEVTTRMSPDGLTVMNSTNHLHVFYNGRVFRTAIQEADGSWSVTTHGIGNNRIPGMSDVNQRSGPGIFQTLDQAMAEYIRKKHQGND